jgi:cytoskeletal protein RodZ
MKDKKLKEKDQAANKNSAVKIKNNDKSKKLSILYIVLMSICTALLITLIVFEAIQIQKNQQLKSEEASVVEEYNNLVTENDNLSDPDYAQIYFDGNNIYIPSHDVIIEFHG